MREVGSLAGSWHPVLRRGRERGPDSVLCIVYIAFNHGSLVKGRRRLLFCPVWFCLEWRVGGCSYNFVFKRCTLGKGRKAKKEGVGWEGWERKRVWRGGTNGIAYTHSSRHVVLWKETRRFYKLEESERFGLMLGCDDDGGGFYMFGFTHLA